MKSRKKSEGISNEILARLDTTPFLGCGLQCCVGVNETTHFLNIASKKAWIRGSEDK